MVAIKDMDMPENCYECIVKSYCGEGIAEGWLTNRRADDCPLVEIEERKVGKWLMPDKYYDKNIWRKCSVCNTHFEKYHKYVAFSGEVTYTETIANYCKVCGAEMRGSENG